MIDTDRLVQSFCQLVRIDSPSGEEEAVAQHLRGRLEALGLRVERDAHGNVIASEDGEAPTAAVSPHGHGGAGPRRQASNRG